MPWGSDRVVAPFHRPAPLGQQMDEPSALDVPCDEGLARQRYAPPGDRGLDNGGGGVDLQASTRTGSCRLREEGRKMRAYRNVDTRLMFDDFFAKMPANFG